MFTTMCVNICVEFMTKGSPTYYTDIIFKTIIQELRMDILIFYYSFVSHVFEIPINDPFYTKAKGRCYYI